MSVALQPAKPPRSNPPMSSQTKTLRVAVANIIEKKEHRPRLAMLSTGWSDGDGDAERALVQRAKEHRKVNTSVTFSHSTGMWFNHVDAQAIATFQQRTLFIVDSKTATANKIPPLPDRVEPNIEFRNAELPEDRGPLRPHRATLRQLTLRRTPRSQQARLDPTARTPHAAHALAYDGWLEGQLVAHHSLSWESCARFKRADFFRARTRALCWSHINRKFLFVWFA